MEEERRHAYATRLQCWWRCILAVRVKHRKRQALKETPIEDVEEESEKAALVLQVFVYEIFGGIAPRLGCFSPPQASKYCLDTPVSQRDDSEFGNIRSD